MLTHLQMNSVPKLLGQKRCSEKRTPPHLGVLGAWWGKEKHMSFLRAGWMLLCLSEQSKKADDSNMECQS